MAKLFIAVLFCLFSTTAQATEPYYVFYLHGMIVEGSDGRPVSESYGRYEYPQIVEALQNKGFVVISEIRGANTEPRSYALKVSSQIDSLKQKGVSPSHITVIGASKGAHITMLVSTFTKDKDVKYVIMAGCNAPGDGIDMNGQVLSIYEKSDGAGSCANIKKASSGISRYKEVQLNTGLRHGFIYKPMDAWLKPATDWVRR
jgi:hypothetical protein